MVVLHAHDDIATRSWYYLEIAQFVSYFSQEPISVIPLDPSFTLMLSLIDLCFTKLELFCTSPFVSFFFILSSTYRDD